jgi:hypothetical protein
MEVLYTLPIIVGWTDGETFFARCTSPTIAQYAATNI